MIFYQETSRKSLFREYQPPVRDSVTSFYSFQLLFGLLATSVLSSPRGPSTREGYSKAAPPGTALGVAGAATQVTGESNKGSS